MTFPRKANWWGQYWKLIDKGCVIFSSGVSINFFLCVLLFCTRKKKKKSLAGIVVTKNRIVFEKQLVRFTWDDFTRFS